MQNLSSTTREFPAREDQVSNVRQFVASHTAGTAINSDTAVLLASELATNAVLHARPLPGGVFTVTVRTGDGEVTVSVADGGPRTAALVPAPRCGLAESGRGLELVRQLAFRYGTAKTPGRAVTWFALVPDRPGCRPGDRLPGSEAARTGAGCRP